jgi:ABC-type phosphate transport system permease subunit
MNDRELGKALLKLDTTPKLSDLDPRQLARNIVQRDRRRIRLLAGLATVFWVLAAAGMVWLVSFYMIQVAPRLRAYAAGRMQLENDWNDWARAGDLAAKSLLLFLVALLVAAISTVLLILLSRQVTLRQINASLIELSDRLSPQNRPQSSKKDYPE